MKNLFFSLMATLFIVVSSTAQTSKSEWDRMMTSTRSSIDAILDKSRPRNLDMEKYKQKLILGELQLGEEIKRQIEPLMEPLKTYGKEVATKHKLAYVDDSELMAYAAFEPDSPIDSGQYISLHLG